MITSSANIQPSLSAMNTQDSVYESLSLPITSKPTFYLGSTSSPSLEVTSSSFVSVVVMPSLLMVTSSFSSKVMFNVGFTSSPEVNPTSTRSVSLLVMPTFTSSYEASSSFSSEPSLNPASTVASDEVTLAGSSVSPIFVSPKSIAATPTPSPQGEYA